MNNKNLQKKLSEAGSAFYELIENPNKSKDLEAHFLSLGDATALLSCLGDRNFEDLQNTRECGGIVHQSLGPEYLAAATEVVTNYLLNGQINERPYTLEQLARVCWSARDLLEHRKEGLNQATLLKGPFKLDKNRGGRY